MALELSRKELRLRARHPAAAQDQRVVQPRAVDLTVTSPEALVYWHVETGAVCIYSQLRSFSSSEVAAMIEGLVRHDTEMRVEKNFVDSHGQSEVAFAFCHLLGTVRLMPRLKRIKYERLYLPAKGMVGEFPNLTGVLTRSIRGDLITQQYDEMVKAAVALKDGTATAEAILRRFNSYNVTHPTYRHSLCECAHDCTATHGELSARVSSGRSDGVLHILFDCVADLK
jgi:TnpA family transposase